MKTAELTGALLDFWVARAEGMQHVRINRDAEPHACFMWESERGLCSGDAYSPSSKWAQGGPIIDNNAIGFHPISDAEWMAEEHITCHTGRGATPLVAAMRAYVSSTFGDTVHNEEPA